MEIITQIATALESLLDGIRVRLLHIFLVDFHNDFVFSLNGVMDSAGA